MISNIEDFLLHHQGFHELVNPSAIAVVLSFTALIFTIYISHRQQKAQIYDRLSNNWYEIVSRSTLNHTFFDVSITEKYFLKMTEKEQISYEPFCLLVWGLVEEIISRGYKKHKEFVPILQWAVNYHIVWLDKNPIYFREQKFWDEVDKLRKRPQLIQRYLLFPQKENGELNWDKVATSYFNYILSPFDPLMYEGTEARNPIGPEIIQAAEQMVQKKGSITLMDFGCGIGNLYSHLHFDSDLCNKVKIVGVDWSKVALEEAKRIAESKSLEFVPENVDFCDPQLLISKYQEHSIDIIVSVSSLCLENWEQVNKTLSNIGRLLRRGGMFFLIVPSFEGVEDWLNEWTALYKNESGKKHSERVRKSWETNHHFNREDCTFAEDGVYAQCFFTKNKLLELVPKFHGIEIKKGPEQIFYPWPLVKRFGYGLLDTEFELYDWYIVGEKK